ncbi:MAG TPA: lysophospholipid acyltransferase family protein [Burkholderiaceae bacterium]|nr:lysophospholipid acyltransferase family protein [Burkholderiaceae bacterium]
MSAFFVRIWIALIDATLHWSQGARTRLAIVVGDLLWWTVRPRRHITLTNLRLCFPQWSEQERRAVGRRTFRNIARAVFDHSVLALAPRERLLEYVRVTGLEHLNDPANRPLILVAPHFVGLDAGGLRVSMELKAATIYARQRNQAWNDWVLAIRARFNTPLLIAREGFDLRAAIRAMKDGLPLYYLPDQDYGVQHSIFVPFFGNPAATIPMVARLARIAGAKVVMAVSEMTDDGYVLHLEPAWRDFPSEDVQADTARMNREIECWVERIPDQYLWTHRRFKSRPQGAPPLY